MFDLIEEELSNEKKDIEPEAQFKEEEHPVYTMPTTYKRERHAGGGDKKLLLVILGSLFCLAIIGTFLFLFLSRPTEPAPSPAAPTPEPAASDQSVQPEQSAAPEQQPIAEPEPEKEGEKETEVEASPSEPTPVLAQEPAIPLLGIDSDQDGLTDIEERLYSTNAQSADSDSDSFLDGDEIKNMYDPLRGDANRLDVSGLVNIYTNQSYEYSLLYPSAWPAKSTDRTDREVMISSSTGEFFTITVQPNPNRLSPVDWYANQAAQAGSDTSQLQSFSYETWSGVMTPDSLRVYLTRNDGDPQKQTVMYVLEYHLNTKKELNVITTMQMMLRSFVFTDLSFVR